MKHPLTRFLVCLIIPPSVGATTYSFTVVAIESSKFTLMELIAGWLFTFLYAAIFCFIPGSLFFLCQEGLSNLWTSSKENRTLYSAIGAGLGLLCGLSLALFLGGALNGFMLLTGMVAGSITAWISFPTPLQPS